MEFNGPFTVRVNLCNSCINTMNAHLWDSQIDSATSAFKDNFERLTVEELNWKPNTKTWSVAQNIHHLIVIN